LFVVKFILKYTIIKIIVIMIKTTVANQNPSKNGDPIGFIDVIYTKFLSCNCS